MKNLILKVGKGEYEGKAYTYLYVEFLINGTSTQVKVKASSKLEKELIERYLEETK